MSLADSPADRNYSRIRIYPLAGNKVRGLESSERRWYVLLSNHDSVDLAREWIERWHPGIPVEIVR